MTPKFSVFESMDFPRNFRSNPLKNLVLFGFFGPITALLVIFCKLEGPNLRKLLGHGVHGKTRIGD